MATRLALFSVFVLLLGASTALAEDKPKDEPKKEPEKIALPWTTDEIKKYVKKGMTMLIRMEDTQGEKTITSHRKIEITAVDGDTYTIRQTSLDARKAVVGKPVEGKKKWAEYMGSFAFTTANTSVSEEKIKVTAGEYDCKAYKTTEKQQNGDSIVTTIWFCKDKAGVFAKLTSDGKYRSVWTLEEFKAGN